MSDNGAPATHTGRPAMHSGLLENADCEFCGNAFVRSRLVEHIQTEHPDRLFKHNGVTTEPFPCPDVKPHVRHKWQPGEKTEFFTCPGSGVVEVPGLGGLQVPADDEPTEPDALAVEECDHENGFGPHGCAGCGASASDVLDKIEPLGFHAWWSKLVDEAAPTIQRKAGEYGSNSLAEMGRMFARAQGRDRIEDHEALEIGCMIYAKGKLERVLDAMLKGRLPSTDTWHDLGVYSSMAQYIRENKRWP